MVIQFILIINRRFDAQLSSITIVRQNTYLYYSFIGLKCALFLINRTYQMFAQHSFVLLYHRFLNVNILKKLRTLNITVQVLDKIYMLKLTNSKHIKWFL